MCGFSGHEVACGDGPEGNRIVVGTSVAHNADGSHIGKCSKVLTKVFVNACLGDFLTVDIIGILNDVDFFFGNFANDTDSKARAREWLTAYKVFRDAEFAARITDFIFEEKAQRFNDFFEIDIIRESAHIMVGFDHCGFAKAGLDDIRINRTLDKEIYSADFFRFFFKHTDEFLTDNLTFRFRLGYSRKFTVKTLLSIHTNKI